MASCFFLFRKVRNYSKCCKSVKKSKVKYVYFAGMRDLDTKVKVVTLVSQHLQIVLWFLTNGLLPENCDSEEEMSGGQYTYPAALLTQAFNNRRQELQKLHR